MLYMELVLLQVSDENVAYSDGLAKTCVCQPLCLLKGLCRAVNIGQLTFDFSFKMKKHLILIDLLLLSFWWNLAL